MKKFCIIIFLIGIILLSSLLLVGGGSDKNEYLRIHIRANSNSEEDQTVKYQVKQVVVDYLTPVVSNSTSKQQLINNLLNAEKDLERVIDNYLDYKGFNYFSNVKIDREKFPTRVYDDLTLESGFYDAVIIELGKAKGDNWWCVVYPPLCFSGEEVNIEYKSKILEIIRDFKARL